MDECMVLLKSKVITLSQLHLFFKCGKASSPKLPRQNLQGLSQCQDFTLNPPYLQKLSYMVRILLVRM